MEKAKIDSALDNVPYLWNLMFQLCQNALFLITSLLFALYWFISYLLIKFKHKYRENLKIFLRTGLFAFVGHLHLVLRSSISPAPPSYFHTIPKSFRRIQCWTYIQNGERMVTDINFSYIIVVNNISDFFATAINNPIVTIKWKLVA